MPSCAWRWCQPDKPSVTAGVRIGCDNLTQVLARGNDQTVPDDLEALDDLLREMEQSPDADLAEDEPQPKLRK